jgi:hypothetical protein
MDAPREVIGHQFTCHLSPHIACLLTGRPPIGHITHPMITFPLTEWSRAMESLSESPVDRDISSDYTSQCE